MKNNNYLHRSLLKNSLNRFPTREPTSIDNIVFYLYPLTFFAAKISEMKKRTVNNFVGIYKCLW